MLHNRLNALRLFESILWYLFLCLESRYVYLEFFTYLKVRTRNMKLYFNNNKNLNNLILSAHNIGLVHADINYRG